MTQLLQTPKVVFFPVKTAQQKLQKIVATAEAYLKKEKKLLFLAKDKVAEDFIDVLLWEFKDSSFIPHETSDVPSKAFIVITTKIENLNHAYAAFNLTQEPLLHDLNLRVIYEFEDTTSSVSSDTAKQKFNSYHKTNSPISYA